MNLQKIINLVSQLNDKTIILIILILAFITRFICLLQLSDAPFFDQPIGDSKVFFNHAHEILKGNIRGDQIPYFSSPYYAFFLAFWMKLSSTDFFILRFVHLIPGMVTCILIYYLAKEVIPEKNKLLALVAALLSIGYGPLTYFDNKLLPTSLTLLFIILSLLFTLYAAKNKKTSLAWLAGGCLGWAITDKMNLLLVVPLLLWMLMNNLTWEKIKIKLAAYFVLGLSMIILPITINNYLLEKDFVLVASNGGANLFIGNHSHSQGVFQLPPQFNIDDLDMERLAEQAVGRSLKPSAASHYWGNQAWGFIKTHPRKTILLLIKKIRLMLNAYEIPNHLGFDFVRKEFAPILIWLVISFGWLMPFALLGMIFYIKQGMTVAGKLVISYVVIYSLSLLPFFITARYRLLIVPVMIIFAAIGLKEVVQAIRYASKKTQLIMALILIVMASLVNHRPHVMLPNTQPQLQVAHTYMMRALSTNRQPKDMERAIIKFKQALEINPRSMSAMINLAYCYELIGYNSGALVLIKQLNQHYPKKETLSLRRNLENKLQQRGDQVNKKAIPVTLFEQARYFEQRQDYFTAMTTYQELVKDQVFHVPAYINLGLIHHQQKDYIKMVLVYKQGLKMNPNNIALVSNLAAAYFYMGKTNKALKLYKKCLRLKPNDQRIIDQIKHIKSIKEA